MPDSRGGQGALERDMRAGARTGSGRSGEAERRSGRAGSTEVGTGDSAQESNLQRPSRIGGAVRWGATAAGAGAGVRADAIDEGAAERAEPTRPADRRGFSAWRGPGAPWGVARPGEVVLPRCKRAQPAAAMTNR